MALLTSKFRAINLPALPGLKSTWLYLTLPFSKSKHLLRAEQNHVAADIPSDQDNKYTYHRMPGSGECNEEKCSKVKGKTKLEQDGMAIWTEQWGTEKATTEQTTE